MRGGAQRRSSLPLNRCRWLRGDVVYDTRHARHLYTLLADIENAGITRDEVLSSLHRQNIGTGVHYRALHLHPYYRETFDYAPGDFPNAEWISDRTISLPLSPKLTDDDVEDVIAAVRRALHHPAT